MGNYKCSECIEKEVNIINELLLDNKYFRSDSLDKEKGIPSQLSKINDLRASREDLKKAIENTNLSQEQKNFVHKMLEENELLENEGIESLKLRIGKNNTSNENTVSEDQKKIIEDQNKQLLEQKKMIEKNKILLNEQEKKLKEEEAFLKKQIEQGLAMQGKKKEEEEKDNNMKDEQDKQRMQGIQIRTLEPPKRENVANEKEEEEQNIDKDKDINKQGNIQQIEIEINKEENEANIETENKNENENDNDNDNDNENEDDNMQDLRKNIRPIRREKEEDYYEEDEQEQEMEEEKEEESPNIENSGNKLLLEQRNEQIFNENQNILGAIEQQMINPYQSQKFKIETYEPIEQGPKNAYGNDDNINEINDEEDKNYNQINDNYGNNDNNYKYKYVKMEMRQSEPKDRKKTDIKKQIIQKEVNNQINYNNNNDSDLHIGPKDSDRNNNNNNNRNSSNYKEIKFKGSFNDELMNANRAELFESMNAFKEGPRDSKRKSLQQNNNLNNDNQYNFRNNALEREKQNLLKKRQLFLERNEITVDELNNNNNFFNIEANPISTSTSNAILTDNNNLMQKNENGPNYQREYRFVKKEIINPSEEEYIMHSQHQELNNYNQNQQQMNYSPKFSGVNNAVGLNISNNQNMNNLDNKQLNDNRHENMMSSLQREFDSNLNMQPSQKEYDITMSEKDNPLVYSDDKGNMNYLEKKYAAYQSRMNQNQNEDY